MERLKAQSSNAEVKRKYHVAVIVVDLVVVVYSDSHSYRATPAIYTVLGKLFV